MVYIYEQQARSYFIHFLIFYCNRGSYLYLIIVIDFHAVDCNVGIYHYLLLFLRDQQDWMNSSANLYYDDLTAKDFIRLISHLDSVVLYLVSSMVLLRRLNSKSNVIMDCSSKINYIRIFIYTAIPVHYAW